MANRDEAHGCRPEQARLQGARKLFPDDSVLLGNLAYVQVLLERPGAVATIEKANRPRPKHP